MQYLYCFVLLSLYFCANAQLKCVCPVLQPVLYSCPDDSLAGIFCVSLDNCTVVNRTCDGTHSLPPPPDSNCTSCPEVSTLSPNYRCADGVSVGGPFCNKTTCHWEYNNCTRAVVDRPGVCPISTSTETCSSLVSYGCKGDIDCGDRMKCCPDSCGMSCKKAVTDLPKPNPGYCPVVVVVPSDPCSRGCTFDVNCTSTTQKCCPTVCGGSECKTAVNNASECTKDACGPPPASAVSCCPDGTTTGPFCINVDGQCRWTFRPCNIPVDNINHDGQCPAIQGVNSNCSSGCERDGSCRTDQKCCFNGCLYAGRQCTTPVTQQCVIAGYRGMRCLDATVAKNLNLPINTPPDGVYLPEDCYRCVENAICSSNGTDCNWSPGFKECLNKCTQPRNDTGNTCGSRSICDCLSSNNFCGWCQYSKTYTSSTGSVTVSAGRCLHNFLANKCTQDIPSGGFAGNIITVKPTDCSSTSISPNVVDPSSLIKDAKVAEIIKKVSDGSFSIPDCQDKLTALGIKDVIINDVSSGFASSDGLSGKIHLALENLGSLTTDQIVAALKKALANSFGIDVSQITIDLLPASGARKRAGGTSYLADSTVNSGTTGTSPQPQPVPTGPTPTGPTPTGPAPTGGVKSPSSGSSFSPVWFLILLLLLPIWRS